MPDNKPFLALKNAGIQADPSPMTQFRSEHPWIAKTADFLTGGATDPYHQTGPLDVAAAALPFVHGIPGAIEGLVDALPESAPKGIASFGGHIPGMGPKNTTASLEDFVRSGDVVDRMYRQANPSFRGMQLGGAWGDRGFNEAAEALGAGKYGTLEAVPPPVDIQADPTSRDVNEMIKRLQGGLSKVPSR